MDTFGHSILSLLQQFHLGNRILLRHGSRYAKICQPLLPILLFLFNAFFLLTGLSVGFCEPVEINDWSRLFTIFYVLMGSTIVSSGIGTMVGFLLSTRQSLIQAEHKIGAFSIHDDVGKVTVGSVCRFVWYHLKYLSGWYTNRPLTILVILFIMWVIWGTGLTMKLERYTFIQGVYWSVTTMATGGLQSASCLDGTSGTTCDLGSLRGGIMGFFMMIGVPLYCVTIGQVARITVAASLQEHQKQMLRKPIEDADFIFAANVLSPEGSTTLVLGKFSFLRPFHQCYTMQINHSYTVLPRSLLCFQVSIFCWN